jgi:hypothetical protein
MILAAMAATIGAFQPAPCALEGVPAAFEQKHSIQCGWVTVPLRHEAVGGKLIRLWTARIGAAGPFRATILCCTSTAARESAATNPEIRPIGTGEPARSIRRWCPRLPTTAWTGYAPPSGRALPIPPSSRRFPAPSRRCSTGSLDPATPTIDAYQTTRFLSNATLVEVRGASHGPMVEDDCTSTIARAFLAEPSAPAEVGCMVQREPVAFATDGLDELLSPPGE